MNAPLVAGAVWALPWWLTLAFGAWRWRGSPSLDDVPASPPEDAPPLSVIVPARNEARHIARCVRSILDSSYPALELVVVDDHSTDGTAEVARAAAAGDPRLRLVVPPPLPDGWIGKQWACEQGGRTATGTILLFTDADVRHAGDLHARMVRTMLLTGADLLTVAGRQEALTFWERVAQPFVFSLLALRFGGAATVNRSARARDKIANGQCLAFRRSAWESFGGHGAVRDRAAEDLAFAQGMFARGYRTHLTLGTRQLSTRMYTSLGEIVAGWRKNVYAAGRETLPAGAIGEALARVLVPLPAIWSLAPVVALVVALALPGFPTLLAFGALATAAQLLWFGAVDREFGISFVYALAFPLGAAVYLYIALSAVAGGRRIVWKGREYVTPRGP